PKGARVYRRMGEGLGAGGHSTRRYRFNAEASIRFPYPRNYFRTLPRGRRRRRRERARCARSIGSSTWRPSGNSRYRKRMRKRPCPGAAALDHVARADREPPGKAVCKGTHEYPPESNITPGNFSGTNVRTPRRFRDSTTTVTDFCESLWTTSPVSRTQRAGSEPDAREFQNAARSSGA